VTAARRIRLHLATGLVPDVIWIALFAGALLTIGFTLFFGSENLLAQVSMTGVLSLLVTLGLVVIISLDHPFLHPRRCALRGARGIWQAARVARLKAAVRSEREASANDCKRSSQDRA
jgi:hypothetical protein